jgi:hypothetical protein
VATGARVRIQLCIPHLAKNERDMGHPAFVAGSEKATLFIRTGANPVFCQMFKEAPLTGTAYVGERQHTPTSLGQTAPLRQFTVS